MNGETRADAPAGHGKSVIVHVGLPKAASTFLQREFFPFLKGVHFLDHSCCAELRDVHRLVQKANRRLFADPESNLEDLREEAARRVARVSEPAVLISNETFAGDLGIGYLDLESASRALHTIFPNARIFCVLRRQDSFLESLYKHAVAKGYASSIERFINLGAPERVPVISAGAKIYSDQNIDYRRIDLARLATTIVNTFGQQQTLFLPYEMLRDRPDEFFERFLHFAGSSVTRAIDPKRRQNQGLSRQALAILQHSNRIPRLHASKRIDALLGLPESDPTDAPPAWASRLGRLRIRDLVSSLDRLGGYQPARPLKEAARQTICAFHGERNRTLVPLLDVDLEEYGYFESGAPSKSATKPDTASETRPKI